MSNSEHAVHAVPELDGSLIMITTIFSFLLLYHFTDLEQFVSRLASPHATECTSGAWGQRIVWSTSQQQYGRWRSYCTHQP